MFLYEELKLLEQDFIINFLCKWDYCENLLALNFNYNQIGKFYDSTLEVLTVADSVILNRQEALTKTSVFCTKKI